MPADGVITGYGVINSGLVYVYSQDVTAMNGSASIKVKSLRSVDTATPPPHEPKIALICGITPLALTLLM